MIKNILNYKLVLAVICSLLITTSCSDDDNATATVDQITANLNFARTGAEAPVLEDGGTAEFQISLDQALPFDAIGTIVVTSNDGSIETTPGVSEVTFSSQVSLPAGATSANVVLTFNDDTLSDGSEMYTVSLANFRPVDNDFPDFTLITPEMPLSFSVNVLDVLPVQVVTTTGDLVISTGFASGMGLDVDVAVLGGILSDAAGILAAPVIVFGQSVANPEVITLNSGLADGDYSVFIREFSDNYPFDATVVFDFAGGEQEMFDITVDDAMFPGVLSGDIKFYINKETNGSDVTYTITLN